MKELLEWRVLRGLPEVEVDRLELALRGDLSELGDGSGLRVTQRLNGELFQDGNTSDLVFSVRRLVSFASAVFTLEPGDLILTGTPPGVGYARTPRVSLKAGDLVEVEIEGIGVLANPVVDEL